MKRFFGFEIAIFIFFCFCSSVAQATPVYSDLDVAIVYGDDYGLQNGLIVKLDPYLGSIKAINEKFLAETDLIWVDSILIYSNKIFEKSSAVSAILQNYSGGLVITPFCYSSIWGLSPMPERSPAAFAPNFTGDGVMEILDAAHPIFEDVGVNTNYWKCSYNRDLTPDPGATVLALDGLGAGIIASADGRTIATNICPVMGSSEFEIGTTVNALAFTASNCSTPVPEPATFLLFGVGIVFALIFIPRINF